MVLGSGEPFQGYFVQSKLTLGEPLFLTVRDRERKRERSRERERRERERERGRERESHTV
jgi:hypothetical protein